MSSRVGEAPRWWPESMRRVATCRARVRAVNEKEKCGHGSGSRGHVHGHRVHLTYDGTNPVIIV
jgi:hypothetical protein